MKHKKGYTMKNFLIKNELLKKYYNYQRKQGKFKTTAINDMIEFFFEQEGTDENV